MNLIQPSNDLSIALEGVREDAAEFLLQTMNAFGASSDEARDYADTIAAIRATTSLDFQKMRDSFQYLAPISRLLNKDLAYTGALIGVVADSGIKAEQAGRLLASAQLRLAKSGESLNDGLDAINNAIKEGKEETEVLAIATRVFGVNAAKVGATLAVAADKVDIYKDRIDAAGGTLDDLVEQQLESLDAKLKITTSTWERFVLSLDNGEGVFTRVVTGFLSGINKILAGFTLLNSTQEQYNKGLEENVFDKRYKEMKKVL